MQPDLIGPLLLYISAWFRACQALCIFELLCSPFSLVLFYYIFQHGFERAKHWVSSSCYAVCSHWSSSIIYFSIVSSVPSTGYLGAVMQLVLIGPLLLYISAWFRACQALCIFELLCTLFSLVLLIIYLVEKWRRKIYGDRYVLLFIINSILLFANGKLKL